jgi:hypothetical protein
VGEHGIAEPLTPWAENERKGLESHNLLQGDVHMTQRLLTRSHLLKVPLPISSTTLVTHSLTEGPLGYIPDPN